MKERPYYIGFDGGGSGSRVRLAQGGQIIREYQTDDPAQMTDDSDRARATCLKAITVIAGELLLERANISVCAGLAGAKVSPFRADLERDIRQLGCSSSIVCSDAVTSYMGATAGDTGIVAAIGTGSVFIAPDHTGCLKIIGGEGFAHGDIGSGAWLGSKVYQMGRDAIAKDYAQMVPSIIEAYDQGNPAVIKVIEEAVEGLTASIERLETSQKLKVFLVGGLAPFYRKLLRPSFGARLCEPVGTALDGACMLAKHNHIYQSAGKVLDINRVPIDGCP